MEGLVLEGLVVEGLVRQHLFQLRLSVQDVHVEGGPGHVHAGPAYGDDVEACLRGVVATQDGAVLLAVTVHLHLEGTWGTESRGGGLAAYLRDRV